MINGKITTGCPMNRSACDYASNRFCKTIFLG